MDFEIENNLRNILNKDEKLLWTGQPRTGIVFRATDVFLIPFSLFWFGFAIFWEYNVLKIGFSLFALFGLPFILMGMYISIGRFFIDAIKRKNTIYGITDNRIIIKSGILSTDTKSLNIRTISDLSFKEKSDGSGTISIGPTDFRYTIFSAMGYWPGVKLPPSLDLINDVRKVYHLLIEQQRKF